MIYNLPVITVPNTTSPNGTGSTAPTFRATTSCPDVSLWLVIAVVAGIVIGRSLRK